MHLKENNSAQYLLKGKHDCVDEVSNIGRNMKNSVTFATLFQAKKNLHFQID